MFTNGNVCIILTRKLQLRRSTFPPISTKRTITHQIVEYRKFREMWNTGERFIRSQTPPLWIIRSHDFCEKFLYDIYIIRTTKVYIINVRWSRRYKYFKIIITIWLTVAKYPYLKWQRILSVVRIFLLSSLTDKIVNRRNCLPFVSTLFQPLSSFWCGVCVVYIFSLFLDLFINVFGVSWVHHQF